MGMLLSNLKQQRNPIQSLSQNRVGTDSDDNGSSGSVFSKIAVHMFNFHSDKKDANSNEVSKFPGAKSNFFMSSGNKKQAWDAGL